MSILTSCVSTALLIIIITCLHKLNATAVLALWETSINWEKVYRSILVYLHVFPLSLHAPRTQNVPANLLYYTCMCVDTHISCGHMYRLFSCVGSNVVEYSTFFLSSFYCKCWYVFLACCWNKCSRTLHEDMSYALCLDIFQQMLSNAVVEGSPWMQWAQ